MTVLHSGSNNKYSSNWSKAFGKGAAKRTKAKSAKRPAAKSAKKSKRK